MKKLIFVIGVLMGLSHYSEPQRSVEFGVGSGMQGLHIFLSALITAACSCLCLGDPVLMILNPWDLIVIESIRWISPSICHYILHLVDCCVLLIICIAYRLLLVSLWAVLAVTYVASTAVKCGQERLMSLRLSVAAPQSTAEGKNERTEI